MVLKDVSVQRILNPIRFSCKKSGQTSQAKGLGGGWVCSILVKSYFRSHCGSHQSWAWLLNPCWSRVGGCLSNLILDLTLALNRTKLGNSKMWVPKTFYPVVWSLSDKLLLFPKTNKKWSHAISKTVIKLVHAVAGQVKMYYKPHNVCLTLS